jgi:Protein of unknown function (DUF2934)
MQVNRPTDQQISQRAYEIFVQSGRKPGHDMDNWLQAEYELMQLPVKRIPKEQFNQLLPPHQALESLTGEEVDWFAAKPGGLLGTVAKGKGEAGWNYVILKQKKTGGVKVCNVEANFFNRDAARVDLMLTMAAAATKPSRQSSRELVSFPLA